MASDTPKKSVFAGEIFDKNNLMFIEVLLCHLIRMSNTNKSSIKHNLDIYLITKLRSERKKIVDIIKAKTIYYFVKPDTMGRRHQTNSFSEKKLI